ncbi:MAG: hypothetical protein ABJG95_20915 [Rhizobiaceae bacterium]
MTNADPFKRFENWSKEYWGQDASEPEPLTEKQQKIVSKNIRLLLDAEKWEAEVEAFESSLEALKDPDAALAKRSDFHVRFDACQLDDSLKDVSNYRFPCDVSFNDAKFGDGYVSFNNAKFGDGYVSFNNAKFGDGHVSFNNAKFGDGNVLFNNAKFGDGGVSLIDAEFGDGDVLFHDTIFGDGDVWFHDAIFGDGNVSFNNAKFGDGDVSFHDAKFGDGNVLFNSAKFGDGDVSFSSAKFRNGTVWFNNAKFGDGNVLFMDAIFGDGEVSFRYAIFGDGYVSFNDAKFGDGNVMFNSAKFGDDGVSFNGVKFGDGEVSFNDAKFGDGDVWFNDAIFGDVYVWFNNAKFGDGNVSFNGAEFGDGKVSFMDAKFGDGNVLFVDLSLSSTSMAASAMEVEGNLYVKSLFPQHSDFSQLRVNGTASFLGSKFAEVPDFRNAHFVRPPEVAAMRVEPPKMHRKPGALFIHASNQDDVHKYRKLKGMAQAAHDHEKDGEFFAFEMMAKRGWETTTWWELLANTIYYRVSGYGQRYDLPMLGLIISWFIFGLGNLSLAGDPAALSERIKFAFAYSFNNTVPFLGSLRRFVGQPEEHISHFDKVFTDIASSGANIDLMVSVAVLQQLIGLLLLFFVLLGLRTRFRLK